MASKKRDLGSFLPNMIGPVVLRADGEDITPRGVIDFVNATFEDTEPDETVEGLELGKTTITLGGAGNVTDDTATFGTNKTVLSFVLEPQTDDAPHGQSLSLPIYSVPASMVIDCCGTALCVNETDGSVDLIDFRAQFQRIGSGALGAIGTPDNIAKIGGVDQSAEFAISSNDVHVLIQASSGDTRKWTITVQIQLRPS